MSRLIKIAIDTAVIKALKDQNALKRFRPEKFIPFDPVTRKRTEATVIDGAGKSLRVAKGAPQAIVNLAEPPAEIAARIKRTVDDLAARGFRALAVARSEDDGKTWSLLSILPMFDPPRDDSKATIENAMAKGVRVKMVTGDDTAIARETARQLGLGTNIIPAADAFQRTWIRKMFRRRSPKRSNERTGLPVCLPVCFRSTNTRS